MGKPATADLNVTDIVSACAGATDTVDHIKPTNVTNTSASARRLSSCLRTRLLIIVIGDIESHSGAGRSHGS